MKGFLEIPEYADLIGEAQKYNISYAGKDREQLFADLAGVSTSPAFKDIKTYERSYSAEQLDQMKLRGMTPLRKTVFPKELEKKVLNIIGNDPNSFAGFTFRSPLSNLDYTWNDSVKCNCGKSFKMEWETEKNGIKRTEKVEVKLCPQCGKKWIRLQA